jgi:hypothetical protein
MDHREVWQGRSAGEIGKAVSTDEGVGTVIFLFWFLVFFLANAVVGACVYVWLDAPARYNGALYAWYLDAKSVRLIGGLLQILVLQGWPVALWMYHKERP